MAKDQRPAFYYATWTRKEALLKALGCGLHYDPRRFDARAGEARLDGILLSRQRLPCRPPLSGALAWRVGATA